MPQQVKRFAVSAPAVFLLAAATVVQAGVYGGTAHGDPATGVNRIPDSPIGSCGHCHSSEKKTTVYPLELWRANDNEICYECHRTETVPGIWPGQSVYQTGPHAVDSRTVWPGPTPPPRNDPQAAGKCLNCHTPHGEEDSGGLVPSLKVKRGQDLCLACHDGDPAEDDIAREIAKPYNHGSARGTGSHGADEGGDPNRYSYLGGNRHVSCADCHNPHSVYPDAGNPIPPQASSKNDWVGRVQVTNGGAGSFPTYQYLSPLDRGTPVLEYEICFKCHSSWTQQPPGQDDMARKFNPNNRSHHPVEAQGNNPGIHLDAFVSGYDAASRIFCGDCHGSEDMLSRGPHGSVNTDILKAPYDASGGVSMNPNDLCFQCHQYSVYGDRNGFNPEASRFNKPAQKHGHQFHVGSKGYSCYACHDSHGSEQNIALIVTGRNPGLMQYNSNSSGGTCTPTCHGNESYSINYPR